MGNEEGGGGRGSSGSAPIQVNRDKIVIDIAYCGECGWSLIGKKLCDSVKKKIPKALIDCRPQNEYTGVLKVGFIYQKQKRQIYRGDKEETSGNIQKISSDILTAYQGGKQTKIQIDRT